MPQSQPPSPPDRSEDFCQVCGAPAPFRERELATGKVDLFCRDHIPASWTWMRPSLARLMEKEYLSRASNESSPPPGVGTGSAMSHEVG